MKALRKERAAPGAQFADVPIPELTPRSVLARVKAASFCGTDLHIYHWDEWAARRIKPPLTFGHEFAGEVVEVGSQVTRVRAGDHIAGETHIPCEACYQCRTGQMHVCRNLQLVGVDRDGCFAEYIVLPEICCVKTDPALPWDIATLQEPFGNSVYAVAESDVAGKRVAIFGDGPTGIFATAIARVFGATEILCVGMQPYRMQLLARYAPDCLIDAAKEDAARAILERTQGAGVDAVLEMSGAPDAIHQGFAVLRRGGIFTAFGIPASAVPIEFAEEIILKGITIKAIHGRKMFATWDQVQNLLCSGRIDLTPVITHTFPLAQIDRAMRLLTGKDIRAGKIVLIP
ncbi:MAG: L-threonine 3-dehydrogenase [Deltaproteobacteria bacterium]|nr:L-threonine 3-dehydrogenase [Deltaproteobacteria bacterium]